MAFPQNVTTILFCLYFLLISHVKSSNDFDTSVEVFVEGNGFHRTVNYKVVTNFIEPNCYIALYMKLPSSLFVNVDELADLRRTQKKLIFAYGEKDVESFAEKSFSQDVFLCATLTNNVSLSVPIHQRYQFATDEGGYKNITFPTTQLFLGCQRAIPSLGNALTKIDLCPSCNELANNWHSLPYILKSDAYIWQVAVGCQTHSTIVTLVTLLTTIVGSVFILKAIWQIEFSRSKND